MKLNDLVAATNSTFPKIMAWGWCSGLLLERQTRGTSISQSNQPSYPDLSLQVGLVPLGLGRTWVRPHSSLRAGRLKGNTHRNWERQPKGRLHHIHRASNEDYSTGRKAEKNRKTFCWSRRLIPDETCKIQNYRHSFLPILSARPVIVLWMVPRSGIKEW